MWGDLNHNTISGVSRAENVIQLFADFNIRNWQVDNE